MSALGPPRVFVVSGPSGAGKGTLIDVLLSRVGRLAQAISATTRAPRPGEVDGEDYHFMTPERFAAAVADHAFLEHVTYAGNRYGTLRSEVDRLLADGTSVVVEIELRGARAIRRLLPEAVTIFIAPPSVDALAQRLRDRGMDDPEAIQRRLDEARVELAARAEFEHVILNEDRDAAADELTDLVESILHGEDPDG